jgi:hypothetical protein
LFSNLSILVGGCFHLLGFGGAFVGGGNRPLAFIKVLSWNCQGLAQAPTIRTLRALNRLHRPEVIFLFETKVHAQRTQFVLNHIGFPFWLQIPPIGSKGGLCIAWKHGVDIEPIQQDSNPISCLVYSDPPHSPWLLTCVYAPHTYQRCSDFWEFLSDMGNSFGGPWLLLGDFNLILSSVEKFGGRPFGSLSHRHFEDFVHSNALIGLGFSGNKFTWSNHRQGHVNIRKRLDKNLANKDWVHLFPNFLINIIPASNSDHCPLLLSTVDTY